MNIPIVLEYLRPGEEWFLDGDSYDGLTWLSNTTKPTLDELEAVATEAQEAFIAKQEAKVQARASALAKLVAIGLTPEEIEAL